MQVFMYTKMAFRTITRITTALINRQTTRHYTSLPQFLSCNPSMPWNNRNVLKGLSFSDPCSSTVNSRSRNNVLVLSENSNCFSKCPPLLSGRKRKDLNMRPTILTTANVLRKVKRPEARKTKPRQSNNREPD